VKVLFLDQGRASPDTAMGHVRVKHAFAAGLPELRTPIEYAQVAVPPFNRAQRKFTWTYLPLIGVWNLASVRWHLARSLGARRIIAASLRRDPPDVVHITTDQVAMLLGDLNQRVPCVPSLDTLTIDWVRTTHGVIRRDEPTPGYLRPIGVLERRALRRVPLAIAWTETVAARVRELAPGTRVEVLHPGIDLRAYAPRTGPREPGPLRVLFVGGRWVAKGGPALVEALRPELGERVVLDVVTTEQPEPAPGMTVHRATPGSGLVAELFRRADVFCLPTAVDAVPWVVIEAMASGVPVVSTDVGSIPEMVGEHGRIVAPGDVAALRAALWSVLDDERGRAAMAAGGRARAQERYDARVNTPALIERLAEVAAAAT
jgi:starch synthase